LEKIIQQGNSNANIHAGGYYLVKNDWIYYSNILDDNKLYKQRIDGSEISKLTDSILPWQLNMIDDYIYYVQNGEVYKLSQMNSNSKKIIKNTLKPSFFINPEYRYIENLIVTDKYIFYIQGYENSRQLYRTDINGKHKKLIYNDINNFSIDINNNIIYLTQNAIYSNYSDNYHTNIYKTDINGNNVVKLIEIFKSNNERNNKINIWEDYIYFTDFDGGYQLNRIKNDGTGKEIILKEDCSYLNIYNSYIYYSDVQKDGGIYRINMDGTEKIKLADGFCEYLNISDEYIFYKNFNVDGYNNSKWYMMKFDGSELMEFNNKN